MCRSSSNLLLLFSPLFLLFRAFLFSPLSFAFKSGFWWNFLERFNALFLLLYVYYYYHPPSLFHGKGLRFWLILPYVCSIRRTVHENYLKLTIMSTKYCEKLWTFFRQIEWWWLYLDKRSSRSAIHVVGNQRHNIEALASSRLLTLLSYHWLRLFTRDSQCLNVMLFITVHADCTSAWAIVEIQPSPLNLTDKCPKFLTIFSRHYCKF